jgi:hypothetical protein
VDELARARRVQDLDTAGVLPDPRAERHRRLAEPDLEFRASCTRRRLPASSTPQLERAWAPGRPNGTGAARSASAPATPATRSGYADDHPLPQRIPGPFRKLDAVAALTARLLPAPYDRAPPSPGVPSRLDAPPGSSASSFDRLGVRIPMIVCSAYTRAGTIINTSLVVAVDNDPGPASGWSANPYRVAGSCRRI